jgi:hypothetical protein
MQCIRARWYEHRNVNGSERLKQINELSAGLKKYMLSHVAKSYKIYKAGEMLEGYKSIDGIVKHEGRNMLLAVYPESSPDLGEISRMMQLSSLLSKQGNVLHECLCFTLSGHEIVSQVVGYDQFAGYQEEDTHKLILSDDLPEIDAWKNECADCIHADLCNGNNLPAVNCGSCCNIGSPACGLCAKENMHIFHPNFLTNSGFEIVNVDAENMVIEYDSFYSVNNKLIRLKDKNKPCLTSQELKLTWANDMKLDDPFIKLMTRFNGTIDSLSKDAD